MGHKVYGSGQFSYQTVESSDRRGGTLLIQGLQKATSYTVVVKAFNAAGSGPPSHEMHVATLEEGKIYLIAFKVMVMDSIWEEHWRKMPGIREMT